jgi:hypothetical protein
VAVLTERQAKTSRLPNITLNSNLGEQFGRTIDPSTNQFVTTSGSMSRSFSGEAQT